MKTCVYTLTWNNELILPHFLRHYSFADKVVVYDDGSTDQTERIFKAQHENPNQLRVWRTYHQRSGGEFREDVRADLKSECWLELKGQGYDWVIIVDPDEFLHGCSSLSHYLTEQKHAGNSILPATGYEMVHHEFPTGHTKLVEYIKRGVRNDLYSKTCVWNPETVQCIRFAVGCHWGYFNGGKAPDGTEALNSQPLKPWPLYILQQSNTRANALKLLHYRFMGPDHVGKLWETYKPRMSKKNVENGWDSHCYLPKAEQKRVYNLLQEEAQPVLE